MAWRSINYINIGVIMFILETYMTISQIATYIAIGTIAGIIAISIDKLSRNYHE